MRVLGGDAKCIIGTGFKADIGFARGGPRYMLGVHWSVACMIAALVAFAAYQLVTSHGR